MSKLDELPEYAERNETRGVDRVIEALESNMWEVMDILSNGNPDHEYDSSSEENEGDDFDILLDSLNGTYIRDY